MDRQTDELEINLWVDLTLMIGVLAVEEGEIGRRIGHSLTIGVRRTEEGEIDHHSMIVGHKKEEVANDR